MLAMQQPCNSRFASSCHSRRSGSNCSRPQASYCAMIDLVLTAAIIVITKYYTAINPLIEVINIVVPLL
jgi:hypothetical protein